MDKAYLKQILDRLEYERAIHDEKFAGSAVHADCLPRFDKVISNLKRDLDQQVRIDFSTTVSALPDAIAPAADLEKIAEELDKAHRPQEAADLRHHAEEIVFKELNELDGFDR